MLICLLTRDRNIKGAPAIKKKISARMDEWDKGNHEALISDTLRLLTSNQRLKQGNNDSKQRARIFHRLVMRGKIRAATRFITQRESGGVLQPTEKDTKTYMIDGIPTERTVLQSLKQKHPKARSVTPQTLERYASLPAKPKIIISEEMVAKTCGKLSGGAGLGGLDSTALQ